MRALPCAHDITVEGQTMFRILCELAYALFLDLTELSMKIFLKWRI